MGRSSGLVPCGYHSQPACLSEQSTGSRMASKFSNRVISRHTERPWPAKSPDLSPLDYWVWSLCLDELLRRSPPAFLEDLKDIVENFADSLQKQEAITDQCCQEFEEKS